MDQFSKTCGSRIYLWVQLGGEKDEYFEWPFSRKLIDGPIYNDSSFAGVMAGLLWKTYN